MQRILSKPLRISPLYRRVAKAIIHLSVLGYLSLLLYAGFNDALGADPVKTLIHNSGLTAVILLLLTLAISPLAKALPCGDLIKFRRLLGVYAFVATFYHFSVFALFDLQLDIGLLFGEIIERPYITIGIATFVILFVLTVTSPNKVRKAMGKNWQRLHNGIYIAIVLALVHFSWSEKTWLQSAIYYWAIALFVLSLRKVRFR